MENKLKFNLRHLEDQEIQLQGDLPVETLDLGVTDELIQLNQPLRFDLHVQDMSDSLLVTGSLRLVLDCECVRCLKPFKYEMALPDWAVHLPLQGEDAVSVDNDCVDLTPFVREDMLLEFPQHPLCKPDCAGLKKKARKQQDDGDETEPSTWSALDKLKL
jgi:uncharacterized metal-binding protein YceD (DUF177 family)